MPTIPNTVSKPFTYHVREIRGEAYMSPKPDPQTAGERLLVKARAMLSAPLALRLQIQALRQSFEVLVRLLSTVQAMDPLLWTPILKSFSLYYPMLHKNQGPVLRGLDVGLGLSWRFVPPASRGLKALNTDLGLQVCSRARC